MQPYVTDFGIFEVEDDETGEAKVLRKYHQDTGALVSARAEAVDAINVFVGSVLDISLRYRLDPGQVYDIVSELEDPDDIVEHIRKERQR